MQPNSLLREYQNKERGIITLCGSTSNMVLELLGTTLTAACSPGMRASEINFAIPPLGQNGIAAIQICKFTKSEERYYGWILELKHETVLGDTRLQFELHQPWQPSADRLGQVVEGGVEVVADGKHFSTVPNYDINILLNPATDMTHLPAVAGNLLCQYLYGMINAKQLARLAENFAPKNSPH